MTGFRSKCFLVIILLVMFYSCGAIRPAPNEDKLHARAEKLWEAKVEDDWSTIYEMTVESFREKVEPKKFARAPLLDVKSYSIKKVKVDPPEGEVTVDFQFTHMGFEFDNITKEKWLWENGEWFWNIKPMNFPLTDK